MEANFYWLEVDPFLRILNIIIERDQQKSISEFEKSRVNSTLGLKNASIDYRRLALNYQQLCCYRRYPL